MIPHRAVERFCIEIDRADAERLLGMRRRAKRRPRESVLRTFEEEYERAHELLDARAVWTSADPGALVSDFIDPKVPLAVAVCTIGDALPERVAELFAAGESARGIILDAIGSAAVETVADRTNGRICAWALDEDHDPDLRSSPGYGNWDVREQRTIFDLLAPGEIGVTLNESSMMIPRKSISFVVPLTGRRDGGRRVSRCARCGFVDCEFREV